MRPEAPASVPDGEKAALKLWVVLNRAQQSVAARAAAHVKESGLTIGEFAILDLLYHKGPTLLGEVQKRVLASSGGITFLVDKLVGKGLVERQDCQTDRRARYAVLTDEGGRLMRRIFPRHARHIADALGGLTAKEQQTATDLLRRLGTAAAHHAGD